MLFYSVGEESNFTNLERINISMLQERPQAIIPNDANSTAKWFAPHRPIALHNRPYNGVKVHVAKRYLRVNTVVSLLVYGSAVGALLTRFRSNLLD